MTCKTKTWLAALWTVVTVVELFWMKVKLIPYHVGAPFWMAIGEWEGLRDGLYAGSEALETLWMCLAFGQLALLVLGTVLAGFRQYWLFLGTMGAGVLLRFVMIFHGRAAGMRGAFILGALLYLVVFAGAVWLFTRPDADPPTAAKKRTKKSA